MIIAQTNFRVEPMFMNSSDGRAEGKLLITNPDCTPISGHALQDSKPLIGENLNRNVQWISADDALQFIDVHCVRLEAFGG